VSAWHLQDIYHSRVALLKGGVIESDSIDVGPMFIHSLDDELPNVPSERKPHTPSRRRYAYILSTANG
jgi:hypothetical protein